jgi:hypothetical protein
VVVPEEDEVFPLWHVYFQEIHELPHGCPFLQVLANVDVENSTREIRQINFKRIVIP